MKEYPVSARTNLINISKCVSHWYSFLQVKNWRWLPSMWGGHQGARRTLVVSWSLEKFTASDYLRRACSYTEWWVPNKLVHLHQMRCNVLIRWERKTSFLVVTGKSLCHLSLFCLSALFSETPAFQLYY